MCAHPTLFLIVCLCLSVFVCVCAYVGLCVLVVLPCCWEGDGSSIACETAAWVLGVHGALCTARAELRARVF